MGYLRCPVADQGSLAGSRCARLQGVCIRVERGRRAAERSAPRSPQYRALRLTHERAREAGARLCFIAFPMRRAPNEPPYEIDPELQRLVLAGGADFIDLRVMPELGFEDYRDPIHLRAPGREKYTRRLV